MSANRKSSKPKPGTSREYLLMRLEQGGHVELLNAVRARRLSTYAAAEAAGIIRRPPPPGGIFLGSQNARRRREWAIMMAFRAAAK
jgi:hypothetical protein